MGLVDLHVHSNTSDGTFPSSGVARLVARIRLDVIILIDRDTTAEIAETSRAGAQYGVEIVPDIEVSGPCQGYEIHILGLSVHLEDPVLEHALEQSRERRDERNRKMLRRFAVGSVILTNEELYAGNPNTVITRARVARALLTWGLASPTGQAFKECLQYGGRYCPPRAYLSPDEVMDALLSGGAFVALAHPLQYKPGDKGTQELTASLAGMGTKGLEVYHSSHSRLESMELQAMTSACRLFSAEGSDFHGSNKPDISISRGRGGLKVSFLLLDDIGKVRQS